MKYKDKVYVGQENLLKNKVLVLYTVNSWISVKWVKIVPFIIL